MLQRLVFASALALLTTACAGPLGIEARHEHAQQIAARAGLHAQTIVTDKFKIQAYTRRNDKDAERIHIYVGGDGRAWSAPHRISPNPTPMNPISLKLAAQDKSPQVAYLARPCQYVPLAQETNCSLDKWTSHRYAPKIIKAMDQAIDQLLESNDSGTATRIGLIGFSGGGTVAALLAAHRSDVDWLITVAANLDHAAWTNGHGDTPLHGSLNAADVAPMLSDLPQLHFIGEKDRTIPAEVVRSYLARMGSPNRARLVIVPGFDHLCCWDVDWNQRLQAAIKTLTPVEESDPLPSSK